ncbi:uncharacterized protein MYCFIDRAFT_187826 [Pseudocercospora fijiensis CIRAD86]|uniref:Uncharacterized protein n=1 Tax=Pseudocercospora fijiensis (strain CIRAD86) TaxID=383855 RepID=M3B6Y9_PSEFD|nr:uncharacterized protein MYCFIDRAFT_187826 [Pseudocercospora fijiensis CIRAD86]EME85102.1 hypothetical protein MYCFIDRAFT_187826 [Pseudocercospora fijiensis CIRAD86]
MLTRQAEYAGTAFSRSSPLSAARSPDTASPIFPERAIRPLPKSRLKSKLSPEQVSTLVFPPDPPPISPALSFNIQDTGASAQQPRLTNGDYHHQQEHRHHHAVHHDHCTCGESGDSGDDEVEFDHPDYRYATAPTPNGTALKPDSLQRRLLEASRGSQKPPPPGSAASSADGYESFENTSNKKKRKIPLSGASSMHQSQLSAEMANMGISSPQEDEEGEHGTNCVSSPTVQYSPHSAPPSAGSGTGISGAGRGRYGRQDGKHRRPLGSNTMNTVNGYSRAPARGGDAKNDSGKFQTRTAGFNETESADVISNTDPGIENTGGIISQAIKTAAEQGPLTPSGKGKDNVSLLQSAASPANSATPKTQFTFTCESDSATKMVDQHTHYPAGPPTPARIAHPGTKPAHGTQTSPPLRQQPNNVARPPPPPANTAPPPGQAQQQAAPPPRPKPRRNPTKEYAYQASQRKKNQQYQNYHHRPKPDDMWICEFCEYEDIYGAPPYAMIRRYEIKDRQERKKAAEKKRLLEKAKMKGRKNKKGAGKGKNNNANNAPPAAPAHPQNYDPNLPPPGDDEYYDDEDYAEDHYEPIGPDDQYPQDYYPPPVPTGTPAPSTPAGGGGGARAHA